MKEPWETHHPSVQVRQACFTHYQTPTSPCSTVTPTYTISMQKDTSEDGLVSTRAARLWLRTLDHVCLGQKNWLAQS